MLDGVFESGHYPVVVIWVNEGLPLFNAGRCDLRSDAVQLAHTCVPGHFPGYKVVLPDGYAGRFCG